MKKTGSMKSTAPQLEAYISNLGEYTDTQSEGVWVSFPAAGWQLEAAFEQIGAVNDTQSRWRITDYNSNIPGLTQYLGEFEKLEELNYLGKLLSGQSEPVKNKFAAAVQLGENTQSLKDLINLAYNLDCHELFPTVHTEEEYGHCLIEEREKIQLSEEAACYFDYEAYGRDISINEGGEFTKWGYIYNNQSAFKEQYNGQNIPPDYQIADVPLTVREFIEQYPDTPFDMMTPGGYIYLTPEKAQLMLSEQNVPGNPGASGLEREVSPDELLGQRVLNANFSNGLWHVISEQDAEQAEQERKQSAAQATQATGMENELDLEMEL